MYSIYFKKLIFNFIFLTNNTLLFCDLLSLDIFTNYNVESISLLKSNINMYEFINNTNIADNETLNLIEKQFSHTQYNQLFIVKFFELKDLFYIDCYNSFTSQIFYKNNLNYFINNYNLYFEEKNQYINNNGSVFLYDTTYNYLSNNNLKWYKNGNYNNYIKYHNSNNCLLNDILHKNHYSNVTSSINNKHKIMKFYKMILI